MIIDYNKKIRVPNPRPHFNGGKTKPKSSLEQPNPKPQQVHFHENDHPPDNSSTEASTQTMVHEYLSDGGMDPSDINNVISAFKAKAGNPPQESSRKSNTHQRYVFARANQPMNHLGDRRANEGQAGAEMRVQQRTDRKINILGIDGHELTGLDVVTAAPLFDTQKGAVIGIFHEYAHLGKGRSVHAAGQMEWFNCNVDDRSKVVGGAQRVETPDGYVFPLSIESELVYMHSTLVPTDNDLQQFPHVSFTSPNIWDASVFDHGISLVLLDEINQEADDSLLQDSIFDEIGDLQQQVVHHTFHAYLHESNPAE